MRKKPDGGDGLCIDVADSVHGAGHGPPDTDIEWDLTDGVGKAEADRLAATHKRCDNCNFEYPVGKTECPLCGLPPEQINVQEIGGVQLQQVTTVVKPVKRVLSQEIIATKGSIDKLNLLRKKYGYHAGWPYRMQKIYFGNRR